jgi:translation initiation factor 6
MALRAIDLAGDPYIGVFAKATEDLLFIPPGPPKHLVERMEETLQVPALTVTVAGTRVIGTLVAANKRGVIVGDIVLEEELRAFRERGLEVFRLKGRQNAAGNVVLVNDKAALVHPRLAGSQTQGISDALDVEVEKGTIAGLYTVGSAAVVTPKGLLAHPKIEDDEMEQLKSLFGLDVGIGTINYGSPMIGSGVVANSKGAAFGSPSTGIEKGRVADALGLF